MYYQQNGTYALFNRNRPERMPSLLSVLINAVRTHEAVLIFKNKCRKFE